MSRFYLNPRNSSRSVSILRQWRCAAGRIEIVRDKPKVGNHVAWRIRRNPSPSGLFRTKQGLSKNMVACLAAS
jgi:hypothetical protein